MVYVIKYSCFNHPLYFLVFCQILAEKQIDLDAVDLKKLRVKELKKVLSDWGEDCKSCIEKTDFVQRIEELKPKYARKKSEL